MVRRSETGAKVAADTKRLRIGYTFEDAASQRKEVWITFNRAAHGRVDGVPKSTSYAGPSWQASKLGLGQLDHMTKIIELHKPGRDVAHQAYPLWAEHFGEAEFTSRKRNELRSSKRKNDGDGQDQEDRRTSRRIRAKRTDYSSLEIEDLTGTDVEDLDPEEEQANVDQPEQELIMTEYKKIGEHQQSELKLSKPPKTEILHQIRQASWEKTSGEGSGRDIWLDPTWTKHVKEAAALCKGTIQQGGVATQQDRGNSGDIDEVLQKEYAIYGSSRQAIVDCREAIEVVSNDVISLIESGLVLLHQTTGRKSTVAFGRTPPPECFATWSGPKAFETQHQVHKAWKYDIIYSAFAPIEVVAVGPLADALSQLDKWVSMGNPLEEDMSSSEEKYANLGIIMADQAEAIDLLLTEVIDPLGHELDRILKQIGGDRGTVPAFWRRCFEDADDQGKTNVIDEVWKEVTAAWPASALKGSWQRDQLDQLRSLLIHHFTAPVLEICPKIIEAAVLLRGKFQTKKGL